MATAAETLTAAMVAHELWKTRLHAAIATGKCDINRARARRDDACAFGKWLHDSDLQGPRRERVTNLHRRFHLAAARVLDTALLGQKREALQLLHTGSAYATVSSELMDEMATWRNELG